MLRLKPKDLKNNIYFSGAGFGSGFGGFGFGEGDGFGDGDGSGAGAGSGFGEGFVDGDGAGAGAGSGDGAGSQLTLVSGFHIYENLLDNFLSAPLKEMPLYINHPKNEIKETAIKRLRGNGNVPI